MSRHRDIGYFRRYRQVVKMLFREIGHQTDMPAIRGATRQILRRSYADHPRAEFLVLCVNPDRSEYTLVPVGKYEDFRTPQQVRDDPPEGKEAVGYAPPQ